jgi:hypothetical protein
MSASADVLQRPELVAVAAQEKSLSQSQAARPQAGWTPENFGREQIRGLVRRVFFWGEERPVRQVVFSAAEPHTDVASICDQVGHALALETSSHIAIVSRVQAVEEMQTVHPLYAGRIPVKSWSIQLAKNLWRVPECRLRESLGRGEASRWLACLEELRSEFEYSVIHGPVAGTSSEAALLGRLADGLILVLGAHSTRKATACKIKESLQGTHSHILGAILSDRRFPVPERIYRRL